MEQEALPLDGAADADTTPHKSGLSWRIGLALAALILVGILVYSSVQEQVSDQPAVQDTTSAPVLPAIDGLQAAVEANPTSPQAQFELGNALYRQGQLEAAIEAYKHALDLNPKYTAAYANLGVTYYQMQQFELAARQYEKALELDPDDGDVAYNLGALYLQQALSQDNQPDPQLLNQAVSQLEQAQQISPDLAEPYFTLGVAYLALKQPPQAKEAFETFISLGAGQDARAKQEAERYLEMLQQQ